MHNRITCFLLRLLEIIGLQFGHSSCVPFTFVCTCTWRSSITLVFQGNTNVAALVLHRHTNLAAAMWNVDEETLSKAVQLVQLENP